MCKNKIEPLPIEQQMEGLKHAKGYLEGIANYYAPYHKGLCGLLYNYFDYFDIEYEELQQYIPLFTYNNAKKYCGAFNSVYWWGLEDKKSRIKFINWMIKELEKQLKEQK